MDNLVNPKNEIGVEDNPKKRIKRKGHLTSERMKEFWKDPVIREKYKASQKKKRKLSPEVQKAKSERMKAMNEEKKRNGFYDSLSKRNLKRTPEQKENYRQSALRRINCRCPFNMVDGIKKEFIEMDRINTYCGVVTVEQMERLNG